MFIKYNSSLIHLSKAESYEIEAVMSEGVYLFLPYRKILLLDVDFWCSGRPKLPDYAVDDLYEDVVNEITRMLTAKEKLRVIDVDDIMNRLVNEKYEQEWLAKGYITLGKDGSW